MFHGHHGRHILDRIVGLEIGGLAGDDGVIGGVPFGEAIAGEGLNIAEDVQHDLFGDAAR